MINSLLNRYKQHINFLKKQHNLNIKWGHSHGIYDGVKNIIILPSIRNYQHYLIALHEIGHALSNHLIYAREKMERLNNKLLDLDVQITTTKNKLFLFKKLEKLTVEYSLFCDLVYTPEWTWENEMIAWQYAIKNSIIWNKNCEKFAKRSMVSYWTFVGDRPQNMSMTNIYKSYLKFNNTYVNPIFDK